MAEIKITSSELYNAADELRQYNRLFKEKVSALATSEAALKSQWEGEANEEFHKAFTDDQRFMERFAEEIKKYCDTLDTIAGKYRGAERENWRTGHQRTY